MMITDEQSTKPGGTERITDIDGCGGIGGGVHLQAVERQQVGLVHEEHCLRGVSDTFLDFLSPRHRAPRLSRDNINEQRTISFDQKRLDE